jgi:hypothetical protein
VEKQPKVYLFSKFIPKIKLLPSASDPSIGECRMAFQPTNPPRTQCFHDDTDCFKWFLMRTTSSFTSQVSTFWFVASFSGDCRWIWY